MCIHRLALLYLSIYLSIDLLSVAVLNKHVELEWAFVVLAASLGKLYTQNTLVATSFGGACPAESLMRGTWTRLGPLLGAFMEPLWPPWAAPESLWGVSWAPLGSLCGPLGCS